MVHENRLFVGNPGTGKSTLINCLLGKHEFNAGISWASGLTQEYQRYDKDGIAYMDTPGLADESILEQAAKAITTALKQGGTYKLFFMVRLHNGRVVSEDIVTLERVLDSIDAEDIGELDYKYTVVMNNVGEAQYHTLLKRGDEFTKIKTLVNRKHLTESFCFLPRIEALVEANTIVDLPHEFLESVDDAPTIRIVADQVRDIDTSGFARQVQEIRNDLEKLRTEQVALLKEIAAQEKRHAEALRREKARHAAIMGWGDQGHRTNHHVSPISTTVCLIQCNLRSTIRCFLRGMQFISSIVALSTIAASFEAVSPRSSDLTVMLGSHETTFAMIISCVAMLYGLFQIVAVEMCHLVAPIHRLTTVSIDSVFALVLLVSGIVLATSDFVDRCYEYEDDKGFYYDSALHCGNLTTGVVFVFIACAAFLISALLTYFNQLSRSILHEDLEAAQPIPYGEASTPKAYGV